VISSRDLLMKNPALPRKEGKMRTIDSLLKEYEERFVKQHKGDIALIAKIDYVFYTLIEILRFLQDIHYRRK
jgi:hypothetical protein